MAQIPIFLTVLSPRPARLLWGLLLAISLCLGLALPAGARELRQGETTPEITPIATIQSSLSSGDDSALVDQSVTVAGLVTGVYDDLFFVQEPAGGPWSGIAVFQRGHGARVGDSVQVSGTVIEFYDLTEIVDAAIEIQSRDNPLPPPVALTAAQAASEAWEGVLVRVENVRVIGSPNRFGEWTVRDDSGSIRVDDKGVAYPAAVGTELDAVTGVLDHAFDSYRLLPRSLADIQASAGAEPPAFTLPDNLTPIYAIQGDGPESPLSLQRVSSVGLVSGVQADGFYFQDPNGDGDPATSDGIFVYTASAPRVQPGDCALVRAGEVSEYFEKTELSRAVAVETIPAEFCGTGQLSPVAVPLPAPNLDPALLLEPAEGMLVAVEELRGVVQGPTKRFRDGSAEVALIRDESLPFISGGRVFQWNPDDAAGLVFLNSGLGADLPDVAWGDRVRVASAQPGEPVQAVVDYSFGKYLLLLLPGQTLEIEASQPVMDQARLPDENAFRVCSFNLLGLGRGTDQLPDEADYQAALAKRALAIAEGMRACEIIGLQETGTPEDAENLAQVLAEGHGLAYTAIGFGGPGTASREFPLTNSLLVRDDRVTIERAGIEQGCTRFSFSIRLIPGQCPARLFPLFSRPPLVADLLVRGPWGDAYPLTVVVNHWKSKRGDESVNVVRRTLQAEHVASIVQERLDADPEARVVVLGDLNDFYVSEPVLALQNGTDPPLFHPFDLLPVLDRYTYNFNGASQVLDHLLLTPGLLPEFAGVDVLHVNVDFPVPQQPDPATVQRSSDHDPLILTLRPQGSDRPGGSGWLAGTVWVPGVEIRLLDSAGGEIARTVSDGLGAFRFFDLPPGGYELAFTPPAEVALTGPEQPLIVLPGRGTAVEIPARMRPTEIGSAHGLFGALFGLTARTPAP